jgi:hypothetical protein
MGTAFTENQILLIRVALRAGLAMMCVYGAQHTDWSPESQRAAGIFCVLAATFSGIGLVGTRIGMTALEAARFSVIGDGIGFAMAALKTIETMTR